MKPAGETHPARGRGRSPWKQGQDHGELRRPHTLPDMPVAENSMTSSEQGAGGDISRRSTLSADAKEFFPKGYSTGQFEESPMESGDCPPRGPHYNSMTTSIPEQVTTNHIIDVIQHLTLNPGRFDALVEPFVETFGQYLSDAVTARAVVNAIVEQSIIESNFRYSGARLCNYLRNASSFPQTQMNFRACILKRCQEESDQLSMLLTSNPRRLHGYVLFLAELYMQLEVAKGSADHIAILGVAVFEVLNTLMAASTPDNIKCVCQVLKLAGLPLDQQDRPSMNMVFERLMMLIPSICMDPSVSRMIENIIQLRQCTWGNATSIPQLNSSQHLQTAKNEPVFYGPDGQILTREESRFLQDNVRLVQEAEEYDEYGEDGEVWMQDDEMDDEIEAAYEEFLQMTENQSKNT